MPVLSSFCWSDWRIQEILWRLNPSWDYLLAYQLLSLMRQKRSCHVDFIVKTIIHFIDSDHILSIILFITFPESELSEFSASAVLLAANLLALCEEVSWVTASVNLLTYYIWPFEYSRSWVPIEVRVFCRTSVKALNIVLLLSIISLGARELGLEKRHWENGKEDFLEFLQNSSSMLTP